MAGFTPTLSCYAMIFKHFSRQNDIDQDVTGRPRSRAGVDSSPLLVDLAQGDDARHPQAHQQQFRERLMQELLARVQLQAWTNGGMLNAPLSLRLTLVEKLASMLDPGHLALTQIAQHLALLQKWITASTLLSLSSPANCRLV